MEREIYTINKYGRIKISIRKYMEERRLTRNALAKKTSTRFEVINRWYNGDVEKIDADVLARICYVLDVTPGDIIRYDEGEPDGGKME